MKVFVAGTGQTKFGELWAESVESLSAKAAVEALTEASLGLDAIDLVIVGNKLLPQLENQAHVGAVVAEAIGYSGPSLHVEAACASGGLAVRQGLLAIESDAAERVLVIGVEKMTDVSIEEISKALMSASSEEERWAGATFPSLYGLMAGDYLQRYGLTEDWLATPAVKNHFHASLNSLAHFPLEITKKQATESDLVADPIRQLYCSPISDGAAAVVLTKNPESEVAIVGSGHDGETLSLSKRKRLDRIEATTQATEQALKQAGASVEQMDVVEVHDCFTIAEAMALEDLGLVKRGEALKAIDAGFGWLNTKTLSPTINSSGGLKACGHPVGATGVKQVVELARQLRGGLGKRQAKKVTWGLTHNVGGTGATVVVHVLRRVGADEN